LIANDTTSRWGFLSLSRQPVQVRLRRFWLSAAASGIFAVWALCIPGYCGDLAADSLGDSSRQRIDSVEIIRENVFDLSRPQSNNFLFRLANKTHVVTREYVIERELLLHAGQPFDTALANESMRNLRRLPFLLKTDIHLRSGDSGKNIMVVNTSDRWTTVAGLSYKRSGGRYEYQFNLEESNFLGYGIYTSNYYVVPYLDRQYYQGEISGDHFPARGVSSQFEYSDDPRAGRVFLSVSRPLYTLAQKWGGQLAYLSAKDRLDYYVRTDLAAQDHDRRKWVYANSTYRIGPQHIKYIFIGEYSYTDLAALDRVRYVDRVAGSGGDSIAVDSILPPQPQDSLEHLFVGTFQIQQIHYVVYDRLDRFIKPEDFNLGLDAQVSFGVGYNPSLKSSRYFYGAFQPQYTAGIKSMLSIMGLKYEKWFKGSAVLRQRLNYYFKWYWLYSKKQTLAARINYRFDRLEALRYTLYLDEDGGLRGYRLYSYSGENRLVMNLENRIFSRFELMTIGIGGVVFADIGNIWDRDHKIAVRDTRIAIGAGLRFGISRSTRHEIVRLDLAYAVEAARWEISIGTGQYF
jgi:hypothetical protein